MQHEHNHMRLTTPGAELRDEKEDMNITSWTDIGLGSLQNTSQRAAPQVIVLAALLKTSLCVFHPLFVYFQRCDVRW